MTDMGDLIDAYGAAVYGFCRKLSASKADADDLYQQTFLRAMELCGRIDPENNPRSFLLALSAGIWKNNRKKQGRRQRITPQADLEEEDWSQIPGGRDTEDVVLKSDLRMQVQEVVGRLNDKLRIPVLMYYAADMAIPEIASALRLPQGTVKSRLHKARSFIRMELEEKGYEKDE